MQDRKSRFSILHFQSSRVSGWLAFYREPLHLRDLHPSLNPRSSSNRIVPALHVWKILQFHLMHFVAPDPWIGGDICNRILASEVFLLIELLIQDFVKPQRFFMIAFDSVGDFFRQTEEKIGLAEHGPNPTH